MRAKKAGSDHINLEKQLREIARDKHYWEQKRDRIRIADRKVEELEQTYADQLSRIRQERSEILKKAKEEAQRMIADANRQIENTIRTIREAQAEKELTQLARKELNDFRDRVERTDAADAAHDERVAREMEKLERRRQRRAERRQQAGETPEVAQPAVPEKPREAEVGSKVKIAGQDIPGVVLSIKGRKAQVAFGQILTTVDRSSLVVISGAEFKQATRPVQPRTVVSVDVSARKLNFKDHIDVRGLRAAEALRRCGILSTTRSWLASVRSRSCTARGRGAQGGDPPLSAHGAGGRTGCGRTRRPGRSGDYGGDSAYGLTAVM